MASLHCHNQGGNILCSHCQRLSRWSRERAAASSEPAAATCTKCSLHSLQSVHTMDRHSVTALSLLPRPHADDTWQLGPSCCLAHLGLPSTPRQPRLRDSVATHFPVDRLRHFSPAMAYTPSGLPLRHTCYHPFLKRSPMTTTFTGHAEASSETQGCHYHSGVPTIETFQYPGESHKQLFLGHFQYFLKYFQD